jgi:hypothetical protein
VGQNELIEALYSKARRRGGQEAQLAIEVGADEIAAAFSATVSDVAGLQAAGAYFPTGTRKSLFALGAERVEASGLADTQAVQALLGRPPRWEVVGDHSLDFEYVARELTPMASVSAGRRVWLTSSSERRLSLDALLVNADDRTPIVAEIKVGDDENAELGLVQGLAAAAQLSSTRQLRRLYREFHDAFDEGKPPKTLDVYVITARAPERGVRPALAKRAHARARELMGNSALRPWIRRIAFIEMMLTGDQPQFTAVP